ncbi:MAG: TRAP transporter large permease [Deltaproteobacteria bacterium]|nr:TRAP transporter large permease [Deltaproteobacteria bacterium]
MTILMIIMLGSTIGFLIISVPIGFAILNGTLLSMKFAGLPLSMALTRMISGSQSFLLTAIPFFTLAGILMREGGITRRIINFCLIIVGHLKGSLGHVNIVASMIFGGISGSSVADTASIGCVMIPEMKRNGYPADISAAITAVSSTIGIIIPPSIPIILFAMVANVSIGRLFLAGAVPGILVGLGQMIVNTFVSRKHGFKAHRKHLASFMEVIKGVKDGLFALSMPLIIIGGIVLGVVTATEASVLAVVYALFVGFIVYRELDFKKLPAIILEAAEVTGVVMMIVICANALGWMLGYARIPQTISEQFLSLSKNPYIILIIINVILLIVGTVSDLAPNILILTPIFLPIILQLNINPVHFGVVIILNQAIALVTPPVGNCLYICSNIAKVPVEKVFMSGLPFMIANMTILLLVIFIPDICLWLPNLLMK